MAIVGSLNEQNLTGLVAHHRAYSNFRGDVTGNSLTDYLQPLRCDGLVIDSVASSGSNVGGYMENLFESFAFVQTLSKTQTRSGDAGERLRPSKQVLLGHSIWIHIKQAYQWLVALN